MIQLSQETWVLVHDHLRASVGEDAFKAWLESTELEEYDEKNETVIVSVPNDFYHSWVNKRFIKNLEDAVSSVAERSLTVQVVIRPTAGGRESKSSQTSPTAGNDQAETPASSRRTTNRVPSGDTVVQADLFPSEGDDSDRQVYDLGISRGGRRRSPATTGNGNEQADSDGVSLGVVNRLNPRYKFEEFVVGESNRFAHAAAQSVADPDAKGAFNPMFLFSTSGLGKTHLMQAIGHKIRQRDPNCRVLYVTSEQFINQFIASIQYKRSNQFRSLFRNLDLLLIDDVQFFMGKERSQTEFFHTFNALYEAGNKVVVSSDRPPSELHSVEDRLRTRFQWGLLADIQPPDLETRIAILRKKMVHESVFLPDDVVVYVAERVTSNVREMEGTLKQLRMHASLHNRRIDLQIARELLGHVAPGKGKSLLTIDEIQKAVCDYFDIKLADLLGKDRSKKFSQPRHIAQYLTRELTGASFPDIATRFGGKDHTSVLYACRKIDSSLEKDANLANLVAYLRKQILHGKGS